MQKSPLGDLGAAADDRRNVDDLKRIIDE